VHLCSALNVIKILLSKSDDKFQVGVLSDDVDMNFEDKTLLEECAATDWQDPNIVLCIVYNSVGLSKYDYNTISVVIYCNCIVSSNPAIVCIGSVFIAYRIQFIFIINHINQPYYRLRMSLR
jgi:hypothetical protein